MSRIEGKLEAGGPFDLRPDQRVQPVEQAEEVRQEQKGAPSDDLPYQLGKREVVIGYRAGGHPRKQILTQEQAKAMGEGILKQWERAHPSVEE